MRFDNYVASVLNISRNKASELIKSGKVLADGEICTKVSSEVSEAKISLLDEIYVGRGALKLKSFLEAMKFDLAGKNALDIGSSTGGFMQILLESGVKSVMMSEFSLASSQIAGKISAKEIKLTSQVMRSNSFLCVLANSLTSVFS